MPEAYNPDILTSVILGAATIFALYWILVVLVVAVGFAQPSLQVEQEGSDSSSNTPQGLQGA